ncbi:MAG: hypothetical protein HY796_05480 [Elusimicrobia bacterium]|nr:hypothetical protein [Elusimicrobiota bacterium]
MPSIKIPAVAATQKTVIVMADEEGLDLPEVLFKTIQHFVPEFSPALSRIPDPRDPSRTIYPIQECILVGLLAFMLKTRSRRNIKYRLGTPKFISNMRQIGDVLYPQEPFPDTLLHGDTLNKLVSRIPVEL